MNVATPADAGHPIAPALSLADLEAFDPGHKRRDRESDCCCPLCGQGKRVDAAHRSLSYNGQTGAWRCARCGAKGLLREFWTRPQDRPAPLKARERARRERQQQRLAPAPSPKTEAEPERAAKWKAHLDSLRPLAGTPGVAYLEGRGLPVDFCHAQGVRFCADFYGRPAVLFPIRDEAGRLVAMQGRYTDGRSDPKTRTQNRTPGAKAAAVFATAEARAALAEPRDRRAVALTEAPIDALSLAFAGLPAVALCGVSAESTRIPEWLRLGCAWRAVPLAFDGDVAGDAASKALGPALLLVGATVLRLRPDGAKDWNARLVSQGADALRASLHMEMTSESATSPAEPPSQRRASQTKAAHLASGGEGQENTPFFLEDPFTSDKAELCLSGDEELTEPAYPAVLAEHDARALVARVRALLHEACPSWCSVPGLIDAERFRGFAVDEAELVYILRALASRGEAEAWETDTAGQCLRGEPVSTLFFRWKPTPGSEEAAAESIPWLVARQRIEAETKR